MTTRDQILQAVARNKPGPVALPALTDLARVASAGFAQDPVARFTEVLTSIGGQVIPVRQLTQVAEYVNQHYAPPNRIITTIPELAGVAETDWYEQTAHNLATVELALIGAHFGVVENGSVWLTESLLGDALLPHRATPFIVQHLAVVLRATELVATMHDAYDRISGTSYGYGVFIAGPSKTADIEQSLVLGAHGPKTMTVFLLG